MRLNFQCAVGYGEVGEVLAIGSQNDVRRDATNIQGSSQQKMIGERLLI